MVYALITILIVVSIAYRNEVLMMKDMNKPFFYRYRKLLLLVSMAIVPVILMNTFRPNGRSLTPAEVLEDALENGSHSDMLEAYSYNLHFYPDSIPLYLGYIDVVSVESNKRCDQIDFSEFTTDRYTLSVCREYQEMYCTPLNGEASFVPLREYDLMQNAFINYVRGKRAVRNEEYDQAERFFQQEILINPSYDGSYMALYRLYNRYKKEKLDAFILDEQMAKHLPNDLLNYEYFRMGSYGNYLYTIFVERYLEITFMAFFAGLIISIVWLIYLRSMDVFNKERWADIITVFVGGILLTHFCLPMYDYAHYVLHMGINGEFLNDFLYCTIVIGGSEETVKLLPWLIFAWTSRKMKEPYDYILYASVSALGFAFAENWMYLEHSQNIVIRFIMSTVGHMFFASIVAYSMILAKYKVKQRAWKIALPIIGFVLACIAHGFYDFWLISPSTRGLSIVTTVFFILSMHVWFYLKNNAINNSRYYNSTPFNVTYQLNLFMFAVVGILVLEYIYMGIDYGARWANYALRNDAWMLCAFLLYMTSILRNFKPVRGAWLKYRLPRLPKFATTLFSLPERFETESHTRDREKNLIGLELRLFAPKANPYIGKLLPKSGKCVGKITISENPDWYLFELNKPLDYPNFREDFVIVKSKSIQNTLEDDKIEIYLMLIPEGLSLQKPGLDVEDLRYTGRAYSRPI